MISGKKTLAVLAWILTFSLKANGFELSLAGGFYNAPSSQYMYAVSGVELASPNFWGATLALSTLMRPEHKNGPFVENDQFYFARLNYDYTKNKSLKLTSSLGYGALVGSIENSKTNEREEYLLKGPSIGLSARFFISNSYSLSISQNNLIAFASDKQTNAYVAWPYQIYLLSFGTKL